MEQLIQVLHKVIWEKISQDDNIYELQEILDLTQKNVKELTMNKVQFHYFKVQKLHFKTRYSSIKEIIIK